VVGTAEVDQLEDDLLGAVVVRSTECHRQSDLAYWKGLATDTSQTYL
jgi:hypothetical protein